VSYDIKFSPPHITEEDIKAVDEVLRSGWITTGPKTKLFEKEIAKFCGTSRAAALNSATAALELTLRLLGIGPGDEVITSAYTYSASCSVICHVGATPVLVDTFPGSFEMDYEKMSDAINSRTKAVIPVDIGGIMCDYSKVFEIVKKKKPLFEPNGKLQEALGRVAVIADAAHSFGAKRNEIRSGNAADFTCFSFHAIKNLTTAEGGAVTWRNLKSMDDEEIYKSYMLLSLHGQNKDALAKTQLGAWEYDIIWPGYKFNMTDIMAALGLSQLERYESILERRKEIVLMYDKGLRGSSFWKANHLSNVGTSSCHLYMVRLLGKSEDERNRCIAQMARAGIATNVHYKPLPLFTAYKNLGFKINDFPQAYAMYQNEISLPLHTQLKDEEVKYIIKTIKKYV